MPPKSRRPRNKNGKPGTGGGGGGGGGQQQKQQQQKRGPQPPPPGFGSAAPKDPPPLLDDDDDEMSTHASVHSTTSTAAPHTYCVVCYTDDLPRHRAVTPCGHDDVCGPCHLRLRFLHSDKKCPVCKTVNDKIIVDADPPPNHDNDTSLTLDDETHTHKPFDSYELWGDELGAGFTFRDDVGMFFTTPYYTTDVLPVFSLACNASGCGFTNDADSYVESSKFDPNKPNAKQKKEVKRMGGMRGLNDHLRTQHGLTLCHLCVTSKRDFVSRLPRFSPAQLKGHQGRGDGTGSGFAGHPLCEFCRPRRFYDLTKLHEHLNKDHYKCHICDKQGKPNQFFKNYDTLARHFEREHFLCHNPQCLAARFVVFENEIDFRAHERNTHGGGGVDAGGSTKINLEFRIRRSGEGEGSENQEAPREEDFQFGLDGEAFVPEALPQTQQQQENEPEISHPQHAERTAVLRAEAAQVRERDRRRDQEEAFPTLAASAAAEDGQEQGGGDGRGMVGWTSEGRTGLGRRGKSQMTKDDFPALVPTSHAANMVAAKARRGGGGGYGAGRASAPGAPSVSWSSSTPASGAGAARSASSVAASSAQPFVIPSASGIGRVANSQSNLKAENFPSLGVPSGGGARGGISSGSGKPQYAAAQALARKLKNQPQQQQSVSMGSSDFPSLSAPTSKKAAKPKAKPPTKAALDNVMDFPPPSSSSASGNLASGKATVENMKIALGTANYKKLKALTKDFAAGNVNPDTYVDLAAALFDEGIADQDLWTFLPSLIQSCPDGHNSTRAMKYLESLRLANAMQEREYTNSSSNNSNGLYLKQQNPPPSTGAYASAASAVVPNRTVSNRTAAVPYGARVVPGKNKSSWGGAGGPSTVVRAKAPPGSVAAQAAAPQSGTATKYMAKAKAEERKQKQSESQQNQQQSGGNDSKQSKKAKQKKKNDELRSLAFGGK